MLSYIFFYISSYYSFFKLVGRTRAPPHFLIFVSEIIIYRIFQYAVIEYLFFIKGGLKAIFDMLRHNSNNSGDIVTHADYNRCTGNGFDLWAPWGAQYFVEQRAPQGAPNITSNPERTSKLSIRYTTPQSICAATFRFLYDNEITIFVISRMIRVSELLTLGRPGVPQIKTRKTLSVSTILLNSGKNDKTFLYDNEKSKITINRRNFENMCLY